ncbi:hypothetical protein ALC53_10829 [Atta colombica]|uniref:Uncharacterized protein n=1 Tax=Atta colombica TaxID=520822 RepID=A0A195B3D0_9HYME|nr:hypothetical protein ALC53_10829 [Atta colombica]
MTRLHADCRSGRFNGVIWLVSRSDKSTKLFRAENAVWYIEPTQIYMFPFVKSIHPTGIVSLPWNRSNGPRCCTWWLRSRPEERRKVYGLVNKGTVKPICLFISANERLRMHQVRGGCVCMRRGSFWARSVILVQMITDKARLIYPSGCGKFRDDSYEEACKSRDILGNEWIFAEFQRRSTLRWSFDHRLHVFASTPITVLKSARILADFSRLRPPRGIGFLDINRRSNEIDPRYHGTHDHILHSDTFVDVHDDFTLLTSYRMDIPEATKRLLPKREDEIASTRGDAVAGSRARGMKHRVASWDRASSACLVFCRAVPCSAVPCSAVHARLFHAR